MGPRGIRMGSGEGSTMWNFIVLYRSPNICIVFVFVLKGVAIAVQCTATFLRSIVLRVFENRILRRVFGPKRMRMGSGEGSTMRNFIVCIVHLMLSVWLNLED